MEPKKPVSIDDVARAAGVAPSTVSKTLNRTTQRRKPTEVQDRIRRIAAELGYRPNHTARSLSKGHTDIIGLYWGFDFDTLDPFFAQFVNGIRAGCRKHMKDVLMHGTFHKHPLNDLFEELTDGKTDGLVIYPWITEAVNQRLVEANFPVVTVAHASPGLPVVYVDAEQASRIAVEQLAARGHKHIMYRDVMRGHSPDQRFEAFEEAATQHNMTYVRAHALDWLGRLDDDEIAILALPPDKRPTAAVCFNDTYAYKLIEHCFKIGMRIPDDLAVIGFDGAFVWHAHPQKLATILAPWDKVAETAVDIVIDRIEGREYPMQTVIPVSWVDGETV